MSLILQTTSLSNQDLAAGAVLATYTAAADGVVAAQIRLSALHPTAAVITVTAAVLDASDNVLASWQSAGPKVAATDTVWLSRMMGPVTLAAGQKLRLTVASSNASDTLASSVVQVVDAAYSLIEGEPILSTTSASSQDLSAGAVLATHEAEFDQAILPQVRLYALHPTAAVLTAWLRILDASDNVLAGAEFSGVKASATDTTWIATGLPVVTLAEGQKLRVMVTSSNANDTLVASVASILNVSAYAAYATISPTTLDAIRDGLALEVTAQAIASNALDAAGVRGAIGLAAADLDDQLGGIGSAIGSIDVQESVEAGLAEFGAAKTGDEMKLESATVTAIRNGLSTLTAQQVWEYSSRSLTTFGALVSDTASAVWGATTRTLSAFSFTPSLHASYDAAKTAAQQADLLLVKTKTTNLPATPAAKGDEMKLESSVVTAIRSGLATAANVAAVPAAVWAVTTRTLSGFGTLAADTATAVWTHVSRLTKEQVRTEMDTNSTSLAAIESSLDVTTIILDDLTEDNAGTYRFTAAALELAPTESGNGAVIFTYMLTSSLSADPIANARVEVYSDVLLSNIVASGFTDVLGKVVFALDPGTYYFVRSKPGWAFDNPDTEVVSS